MKKVVLLFLLVSVQTQSDPLKSPERLVLYTNMADSSHILSSEAEAEDVNRANHPLARFWKINSGLGIVGTVLNSFVLYIFYIERHSMVTSVNAMIWLN